MLTTHHSQKPENLVEYSFKEQAFITIPLPSDAITLLEVEGSCLHKESPEAIAQLEAEGWSGMFMWHNDIVNSVTVLFTSWIQFWISLFALQVILQLDFAVLCGPGFWEIFQEAEPWSVKTE